MDATVKFTLILPCYNEMEHIHVSLPRILSYLKYVFPNDDYEIILVDDGSSDGTREWLQRFRDAHTHVHLNAKNLGRGGAVKVGMSMARGRTIGFIDIDLEVSESYLPKFIQIIESGVDYANALRIYRVTMTPYILIRHILSVGYRAFLRQILSCGVRDTEAGYKFFSRRFVEYFLTQSKFDDWFCDTEISLLAEFGEFQIVELPVAFLRNVAKTSTVKVFSDSINYLRAAAKFIAMKSRGVYSRPEKKSSNVARVA